MSTIHKATIAHMHNVGYDAYQCAHQEVLGLMVGTLVRTVLENPPAPGEGDWKDHASALSCSLSVELGRVECRRTRAALGAELGRLGLLDGLSCPRKFYRALEAIRG